MAHFVACKPFGIGERYGRSRLYPRAVKLLGVLDHETTLVEQHLDEGSKSRIAAIVESHRDWLVGSPDPDCPDADLA